MGVQKGIRTFKNGINRGVMAANNFICKSKEHLSGDTASENVQSTILIVACFVVGALLIGILVYFFGTDIKTWLKQTASLWFGPAGIVPPEGV